MLRRIAAMLAKDLRVGMRESIITYLLLGPFIIAFFARLVLPLVTGLPLVFAVMPGVDPVVLSALQERGEVIVFDSRDELIQRVAASDDVPGFLPARDGTEIVFEGNEAEYVKDLAASIVDVARLGATGAALPAFDRVDFGEAGAPVSAMMGALLAFSVLAVVGLAVGFSILDEKESDTIRAYAVSPMRFWEYFVAKLSVGIAVSIPLGYATTRLMLGDVVPGEPFLLALGASLPIALLLGLLVGTYARDQLGAVAMLKALLFFFLSLPVAGFFVNGFWATVMAPFPNHWAVQALFAALEGRSIARPAALAFGLGLPPFLAAMMVLRARYLGRGSRRVAAR